jgi:hypothetical protein
VSYSGGFVAVGPNVDNYPIFSIGTITQETTEGTTEGTTTNTKISNSRKVPCFKEGTKILCNVEGNDVYIPVEQIKPGTLVKTSIHGYKKVVIIGSKLLYNPGTNERSKDRLYKCSPSKYPELTEDLYITGCHSILVGSITDKEREGIIKYLTRIFITDQTYRLIACVDERAEPWESEGSYRIWHFALEHTNIFMNYGVYANGLLVETSSINYLKNKSDMVTSSAIVKTTP